MRIGAIDTDEKILIVAEIGNNHEGSFTTAVRMVQEVARTGADAVKFQTFRTEHYVNPIQNERFQRLKSFELTFPQFADLGRIAHEEGLLFISTPFDLLSARFLGEFADAIKISSSDNTFFPLIREAVLTGKPLLMSTGLASVAEIRPAVAIIQNDRKSQADFALLHCVCSYPAAEGSLNLIQIRRLQDEFHCVVGYSDHSLGVEASVVAVGAGARIVEKHFTLNKNFSDFRDHKLSADPSEMSQLVNRIRQTERMLGSHETEVSSEELPIKKQLRRSIVAARKLDSGHLIEADDISWTRPGEGIAPGNEPMVVGRRLKRALETGEMISLDSLESNL